MSAVLLILAFLTLIGVVTAGGRRLLTNHARALGIDSVGDYLNYVPRKEAEIEDAIDLTVKGVALAALDVVIGPLAPMPLFFGVRRLLRSRMLPTYLPEPGER